ncbi:hypothetical protein FQN50_008925 [Emmonsiellopsis sp. PD_5]|nr:hypothetical protein FQN50_008925 [Emmonsiellopsis sp. PD_5]
MTSTIPQSYAHHHQQKHTHILSPTPKQPLSLSTANTTFSQDISRAMQAASSTGPKYASASYRDRFDHDDHPPPPPPSPVGFSHAGAAGR